jgi:hypothetical protein
VSGVKIHDTLTVDDLFRAADLIAAVLDKVDAETITKLQSPEADRMEIGRTLVTVALRVAPEAGRRFLAGLVDRNPEDFGLLSMDAVLDIAEQLKDREDVRDFFGRARALAGSFGSAEAAPAEPASSTGA